MALSRSSRPFPARSVRMVVALSAAGAVGLLGGCATDSSLNVAATSAARAAASAPAPESSPAPTATSSSPAPATGQQPTAGPTTPAVAAMPGPFGSAADLALLDAVTISTGDKGPALKLGATPLQVSATTRRVVTPGSGPAAQVGQVLMINALVVKGSDGSVLESTYGDRVQSLAISPTGALKGLVTGLAGVQQGSRVLVAVPPADSFDGKGNPQAGISPTEHLLFLFDIVEVVASQASGTPVPPVAGLPTVTSFDTVKGPQVSVPSSPAPTSLVSQTLIEGSGAAVQAGQTVLVQYTGVLWKDGSVFDSSWTRGQPFPVENVGQASVIAAWNKGFVGKKVGSRVLLVVPPSEGYGDAGSPPKISGTDTLVFVVDILSAR